MRSIQEIHSRVEQLRHANAAADQRRKDVRDVRSGDVDTVMPGSLPDMWPKPIVANVVDTAARDVAEMIGVMPSINCSSGNGTGSSQRKQSSSSKRTKIANFIVQESKLAAGRQIEFADHYSTYALGVYMIEPDFERKIPIIRVENPIGCYPETNLFGQLRSFTRVWREKALTLAAKYPEIADVLKGRNNRYSDSSWGGMDVEIAKYIDGDQMVIYLPSHAQTVVSRMPNIFGEIPVAIAPRPGFDGELRGAWDDAMWVYLAKSRMALLGLEATEKSVRAPLVVPRDVQKMTFGDDAVIRTDGKVTRVGIDIPQAAFQQEAMFDNELSRAMRTPEVRSGNIDASIITGKGVEALMGTFNTVVTTGQHIIAEALGNAISIAMRMDQTLWPDEKKTIRGTVNGAPFEETYVPSKDIAGDETVDITYGFASGQDPARAIVALLQLRSDQLVSREFVQRQLPMDLDVVQLQSQVDAEQLEDALKSGIQQMMASIGAMAAQGADPTALLEKTASIIDMRNKGKPLHEAVAIAFKPKEAPETPLAGPEASPIGQPTGAAPSGPSGGLQGSSGGVPTDMLSLLTGLSSNGQATMSARTKRNAAI